MQFSRGMWIFFTPGADKLIEMLRAENRRIPRQVFEVVHDHSHEQVEKQHHGQEDKESEVKVGEKGGRIRGGGGRGGGRGGCSVKHEQMPRLARAAAEQQHHRGEETAWRKRVMTFTEFFFHK